MNGSKADMTMKNVKELSNEVSAWENRLSFIKQEIEQLGRQKDSLKQQIEGMQAVHNQSIEKSHVATRQAATAVDEARKKLENDKNEFIATLTGFKQERNAFEKERSASLDMKANYEKMTEKVGAFIVLVKREAEKL